MSLRQINVKIMQRWLEKLRTQSPQSYKTIVKVLRTYEKNEDEYECYIKISHALLAHTDLTKELNNYMAEQNKFVINRPEDEKIKEYLANVKKNRPDVFEKIIQLINDLSKSKGEHSTSMSKNLYARLTDIVRGDPELQKITAEALAFSGEELISRKYLEHLKVPKQNPVAVESQKEVYKQPQVKQALEKEKKTFENVADNYGRQPGGRFNRPLLVGPFTNPSEEKSLIRHIEKMVDQRVYNYIIKIVHIFYLNIITRNEAFQLLAGVQADELYMECLRDIIDCRQTERRKASCFKPLGDINFGNAERASPSYVAMPPYYPIQSSGKTDWIKAITNESWVSVPQGSEQSENFSVRNKNSNEINLLKAEDERYQFDIHMRKLEKTQSLLDSLIDENHVKSEVEREKIVDKIISMGTLQLVYRVCPKEIKQEFQWFLKNAELETCKVFRERINIQITELKNIKQVHAVKNWTEVAAKNFFKALDLKGFEFKKNEKEKMKATFFTNELQERQKLLQNRGEVKNVISFEEKKEFFTVLNSFQCSSRTQKCNNRTIPQIQTFDIKDERNRHLYPLIILAFEDTSVCQNLYSLLLFYIGTFQMGQIEKLRYKGFLQQFFIKFLGWNQQPTREYLSDSFDQEKFYEKINGSEEMVNMKQWIAEEKEQIMHVIDEKEEEYQRENELKKKFGFLRDQISAYSYFPVKNQSKSLLYGSQQLYTFVRFVYAAYERLIKMKEVAQSLQKVQLFKILFYACIKTKQGSKFEQNLNLLFGKHAYLFSTLYKLFDNLIKSLSNVSSCPIMSYSLCIYNQESEDIYLVQLNRFCLNAGMNNNKLIRLTFDKESKAMYFNYIDSYYKSDQTGKDMIRKRAEITKGIEIYTVDNFNLEAKKRRKPNQVLENNEIQYIFEGSTIKMMNHKENEDVLFFVGKKTAGSKIINKRELKRAHRLIQKTN